MFPPFFNDLANASVLAECKFRTTSRGVAKLLKFFSWKFSFTLIDQDLARFFKHNICGEFKTSAKSLRAGLVVRYRVKTVIKSIEC